MRFILVSAEDSSIQKPLDVPDQIVNKSSIKEGKIQKEAEKGGKIQKKAVKTIKSRKKSHQSSKPIIHG